MEPLFNRITHVGDKGCLIKSYASFSFANNQSCTFRFGPICMSSLIFSNKQRVIDGL